MATSGGGPFGIKEPHIANDAEGPYGTHPYKVVITDANGNPVASGGTQVVSGRVTADQGNAGSTSWLVTATQSGAWNVGVNNFPATQAVTVIDGGDVTQGAKADAAATTSSTSGSVVSWLRGIFNACIGPTPAGTNIIGKVSIDQTTNGTTNGIAPAAGATFVTSDTNVLQSTNNAGSSTTKAISVQGNANGVALPVTQIRTTVFQDAYSTAVAASANSALVTHTCGATSAYTKFNAVMVSSQNGTYYVQGSNDGFSSTAISVATGTITSSGAISVTVPLTFQAYRAYVANGTTAATVTIVTSFTAA